MKAFEVRKRADEHGNRVVAPIGKIASRLGSGYEAARFGESGQRTGAHAVEIEAERRRYAAVASDPEVERIQRGDDLDELIAELASGGIDELVFGIERLEWSGGFGAGP